MREKLSHGLMKKYMATQDDHRDVESIPPEELNTLLFFIRNMFIRNWTLDRQKCRKNKKLSRAIFSFLRNFFPFFAHFLWF